MYIIFLYLLIAWLPLEGAEAKISVQITASLENTQIQGEISIAHTASQLVEMASFSVDGAPLQVTKIGDRFPTGQAVEEKNTIVLSTYRFQLPGKSRGLYLFPSVQVKVGGHYISSAPVSFEVTGAVSSEELHLDARVAEKGPFYPGQKITFQYLISFRSPIQLTKEQLPLLEFSGFRTVGAPKIDTLPQDSYTVQLIAQQAVASAPGTFNSGVSLIEGYIYGQDIYGNRVLSQTLLQAQAPSVQVVVVPFPAEGKPVSFNGALGVFYWNVKPISNTNIAVGDKITLQVTVTGSGDFDTVQFPDLSKQKGFKDVFRLSDLAPVGEIKESQKSFVVDLRPIQSGIKMIPSIEFSSFDPISKTYVARKSEPIAISVRPGTGAERQEPNLEGMPPPVWPIEIQGNIILKSSSIQTRHMQDLLLLYTLMVLAALLGAQVMFRKIWRESQKKTEGSRDIILEAIKQKAEPDACCRLLRKALLLRLFEVGITSKLVELPEELAETGLEGEIRALLISIEQKRFMGLEAQLEIKEIINEASQLYYRMK